MTTPIVLSSYTAGLLYFTLVLPIFIGVYLCLGRKICASCPTYGEKWEQSDESILESGVDWTANQGVPCVTRQKDDDAESFLTGKHDRWVS
jgi:hypothetical protein